MKIWSIQPESVYKKLLDEKILYTDISLSNFFNDSVKFQKGYNWLSKRMEDKIGKPEKTQYPWWAWYKKNMKHSKPDLRESGYGNKGENLVCLELELPEEKVVLTDFDLWWFCISDYWISNATSDKEFNEKEEWFNKLKPDEQEKLKIQSWETIFEVELDTKPWHEKGQWVQATFWELNLKDVREVRYFKAR